MNWKADIKSKEQFKILVRAYFPNCEFQNWRSHWVHGVKVSIGGFNIMYGITDFGPPEIHIHGIQKRSRLKDGDYCDVIPAQQRKLVGYLKCIGGSV